MVFLQKSLNIKPEEPPPRTESFSPPTQLDGRTLPPLIHCRAYVPRGLTVHGSAGGLMHAAGDKGAGDRDENQGQSPLHPSFRADSVAYLGKQNFQSNLSLGMSGFQSLFHGRH